MPLCHWNGKRKQGVKTSHLHSNKRCIFSFFKIYNGFLKRGADFEWKCWDSEVLSVKAGVEMLSYPILKVSSCSTP